jgi:outer membrane immunogenic protein
MRKYLLAGVALAALSGAASAADMAVKAPYAPPPPLWSWTGFYVGINGGYSTGADDYTQSLVIPPAPAVTFSSFGSNTINPKGGLFGGQIGFNYQTGPVVWGVEGDWQWANQHNTACGMFCLVNNVPGVVTAVLGTSVDQKLKSFATVRGRIGWANDGWLAYITAGGAWAKIDETDTIVVAPPLAAQGASFSNSVSGGVYGAGIEVRLFGGWTGKLEYLHMDLSGTTNTFAVLPPIATPASPLSTTTSRIRDDIFRVGLNYKIGGWGGPLMAAY